MTTFDWTRSRDYGAARDAAILELARRFRFIQAEDVADLCCQGRPRVARARLLSLHRRGQLQRFTLGTFEPFIYTPGRRSQKARHGLTVLRAYRALRRGLPAGWKVAAFDPEYEIWAGDRRRVVADALVVLDNEMAKRRKVVFLEANLDPVFDQAGGYAELLATRALCKSWWWREGTEVILAVATIRPDYVRRQIAVENVPGLCAAVAPTAELAALWREVFRPAPSPHLSQARGEPGR